MLLLRWLLLLLLLNLCTHANGFHNSDTRLLMLNGLRNVQVVKIVFLAFTVPSLQDF